MTTLQSIPLNRLVQSKSNVRKTGRSNGIGELMALIAAHGLRQNLNVKPTSGNRFEVVAGSRRLEALRRLAKEGRIAAQEPVNCLVLADGDNPQEISLVENAGREAMHPDDQCVAFQALIEGGKSIDDVAARFGVTPAVVRQRLKLACVSPVLRKLFRKGDLDLAQMMAFALVDDHVTQEAVWHDLPDWDRDPAAIKRSLTAGGIQADSRLARFVGIEAYEAAGGVVVHDLFDADQPAVLTDAALVERLAIQKLEEAACYVKGEGWQWVATEPKPDYATAYQRVYPRHVEGSDNTAYDPAEMDRAGARVFLDYQGVLTIERGLIDPASVKKEQRAKAKIGAGADPAFAATMIEDLTAHRTAALRLELAHNPAAALAATVHVLALDLLYGRAYDRSCLELSGRSEYLERHVADLSEGSAHGVLAVEVAAWQETLPTNPADLWDWCAAQDRDRLLDLLALLAGLSVSAIRGKQERSGTPHLRHADRLAEALSLDMHAHWQPSPDGFFSRLSKGMMTHMLNGVGEGQQAAVIAKVKKTEAAHRTASVLMTKGWLPDPLLVTPLDDDDHGDDDDADHASAGAAAGDDDDDGEA